MGMINTKCKRTKKNINLNSTIHQIISCPFCSKTFGKNSHFVELNEHLKGCGILFTEEKNDEKIYQPNDDAKLNEIIFQQMKQYQSKEQKKNIIIDFNKKISDLQGEILKKKISWEKGFCPLTLNRQNFLIESMKQIEKIDVYKEWKINFVGEVCNDAGGIYREWFTILFKELEGNSLKLFIPNEQDEFSYLINPFLIHNDNNFKYFTFIGKLIAKALIDNITINLCFNKLIYKLLLEEDITFDDLVFIDKGLYDSLKNYKQIVATPDETLQLGLYYYIEMNDINNNIHSLDLITNGKNEPVSDIDDYIKKRINIMIGLYEPYVKRIRNSLYKIIPKNIIQNFTSDEFELLLSGRPFIDVEEWKVFTEYKEPYNINHYIITWFWDILYELTQDELSNLLMFSTGTGRVPLGGFSALESNRGNLAKYTIEPIPYIQGQKNFIKAHTCFNRLDIPLFTNKDELREAVALICRHEIIGFGMD